jgi:transposase
VREVLNAVFYVLSTGCQWQALPKDLPPKSTVWGYFSRWEWEGTIERIHHVLYVAVREQEGREASPTTAIIDSQTAKAAQKVALRLIRPATLRRRQGGRRAQAPPTDRHARPAARGDHASRQRAGPRRRRAAAAAGAPTVPLVERIIGDAGYQGPKMAAAVARTSAWKMEVVRRCERHCRIAAAFVRMAMIRIMLRRLAARPSA